MSPEARLLRRLIELEKISSSGALHELTEDGVLRQELSVGEIREAFYSLSTERRFPRSWTVDNRGDCFLTYAPH